MLIKQSKILKAMVVARFAETYPEREFGQQVVAQIPCGYNIVMIDKVSSLEKQLSSIEDIQKRIK